MQQPPELHQDPKDNIVEAIASLVIPGAGQLIQKRPAMAFAMFLFAVILWIGLYLGFIIHLWSAIDAWLWKGDQGTPADLTN